MSIRNFLFTGDTHGHFELLFEKLKRSDCKPEETAIVVLGDSGLNYWRGHDKGSYKMDNHLQQSLQDTGYTWYILRGNHDQRPETTPGTFIHYDDEVANEVYVREAYPNVRYLIDGNIYMFNGRTVLAIGGAYSVDKFYRLARRNLPNDWCGWWSDEQLSGKERDEILGELRAFTPKVDFVLTHTCPRNFQPTDLFLSQIDQSLVDSSMEDWLDIVRKTISWRYWLFGHYHADRVEEQHVIQLYNEVISLEEVEEMWYDYDHRGIAAIEERDWNYRRNGWETQWKTEPRAN